MERDFYPAYFELEGRHWWFTARRRIFLRLLSRMFPGPSQPLEILDFGTGTGAFLEHLGTFGRVRAVDEDREAVEFCRARGCADVQHVAAGAPLPFADATFDLVSALDVLEHIDDDGGALRELHRVLRPGGRLLVAVPAFMSLWGDQDEISHHRRRYRAPLLTERLVSAGFTIDRTTYFNTLLFVPIAVTRIGRRLWRAPSSGRTDFHIGPAVLNRFLGGLFGVEAAIVARARLPFGVSLLAIAQRR